MYPQERLPQVSEFDPPIAVTFMNSTHAYEFIQDLERAREDIIWSVANTEDGTVMVRILNIINLEEKADEEN